MCTTCGCSEAASMDSHHHDHDHDHDHEHAHSSPEARVVKVEVDVMAKSRALAADNRAWLARRGVRMVNVMSAPGAGKTTLLEQVVGVLESPVFVIEGDQATSLDADRIRRAGAKAVQVNTGTGCHLDPHMVRHALEDLAPPRGSVVIVENVGNLVCPALFDLGEDARVVLLSLPEGHDKPVKYPHMFATANLVALTKIDLEPYVAFDIARCKRALAEICPRARVIEVSSTSGAGLDAFTSWLDGAAPTPVEVAR
jgi:hydrogenase nickel incorporation protein HypB